MASNNLGRTETAVNQNNKEVTINGSDAILDAAITDALTVNYSGDVFKTVSDAQLQQHVAFVLTGTPGASPYFKLAAIQRGMIVVKNDTAVAIAVKDYTTTTSYSVPAGGASIIYVEEDSVVGVLGSDSIPEAPADGSTYGRKDNGWVLVGAAYTSENARDDIAAMIAAGVHEGVNIVYDDAGNALSFKVTGSSDYQESVVIAATTNLTLSGTYTTQGVALQVDDRVLAAGQTAAEDRRIWIVQSGAWTIAEGWDITDTITSGTIVPVDEGTYAGQIFQLLTADPITLGVSALSWQSNVATSISNFTIVSAKGSTYTPAASQKRHLFNLDTAGTQSFVVPTNASRAIPVGSEYLVSARTTGTKTINASVGVTINGVSAATLSFGSRYDMWWLKKRAANDWQAWPLVQAAGSSYTDEAAMDAIAAMIAAGTTSAGLTITYNDGSNSLSFAITPTTLLNQLSTGTTQGVIPYRGASGWTTLGPGTAGQLVRMGGTGADIYNTSPSAMLDEFGSSRGSILTRVSAVWTALAPGTSGYVLKSNGTGADLSWVDPGTFTYTDEAAQDAIAAAIAAGSHTGITITYTDGSNKFDFAVSGTGALDTIGTTRGSVLYRGAAGWAILTPGTSGYVLKSNGAGADPSWVDAATVTSSYTDENAQDAIASAFAAGTHDGITITYTDGSNKFDFVAKPKQSIIVAASDESTAITAGTGKVTFRMPYAFTVTEVRASLTTAQTSGSIFTVDINEAGTSIISTKLTIDNGEKTSTTAVTAPVISDSSLADDAEITVDVDQIGDGTAKGLKITLIGYRT